MRLLLAFGIVNACLYAALLPLWEGFDEPFHYSYLEELSRHARLPVLGRSSLTSEVARSLDLAPASHIVRHNLRGVTTFDRHFSQSADQRDAVRLQLARLDPRSAASPSVVPNYEAHQAPLAYLLLAPLDWSLRRAPLLTRVLCLRLFCAILSVLATAALAHSLARRFHLAEPWPRAVVFLALATQMFYATVARVANDWLVIPLFLLLIHSAITMRLAPKPRAVAVFCAVFAAGLLAKAAFLALLPFVAWELFTVRRALSPGAVAPLLLAVPWYVRNVLLYGDASGMQETAGRGLPLSRMAESAVRFPWLKSLYATAMTSLWTGNNSDTRFNQKVLTAMLALAAAAVLFYILRRPKPDVPAVVAACALGSYAAGLLYSTLLSYTVTGGAQFAPSPWYCQPVVVPACCFVAAGAAAMGRNGALLRHALVAASAYVICATWVAKLIPLYGGFPGDRARAGALTAWYAGSFHSISRALSATAMAPAAVIWTLVAVALPLTIAAAVSASRVSVH